MNFFGVGPWEVVLIAILALIFIGPEKLPEIMRQIGRTVGELRRMSSELTREFQDELAPLQEIQSELTGTPKAGQKAADKPPQPATAAKPTPPPSAASASQAAREAAKPPASSPSAAQEKADPSAGAAASAPEAPSLVKAAAAEEGTAAATPSDETAPQAEKTPPTAPEVLPDEAHPSSAAE